MPTTPIEYTVEVCGHRFEARDVEGSEAISSTFQLRVEFAQPRGFLIDPSGLLKEPVSLRLERDGTVLRQIDAIVVEASVAATERGAPDVRLLIAPALALASQRRDSHIFRNRSVPQIVTEVLAAIGVEPELRLQQSYAQRPYCVQYQERDLDFVQRLLEDEGIFYFFAARGRLVLGDSPAAFDPIDGEPVLPFRAPSAMEPGEEAVVAIEERAELSPGRVTLRDFNPEHPSLDMDGSAAVAEASWERCPEYYDFPGEYAEPADGQRKATLQAEGFSCHAADISGTSHCPRLAPGHTFTLTNRPAGFRPGTAEPSFVVKKVDHRWQREERTFGCSFVLRPAQAPYRPAHLTAEPWAPSLVTGIVTGPAGEDIHTDEIGRVKVHFHWDRRQPFDDDCSHWVPVLQDNTGGSSAMPRIGWEVVVSYLEGDPDRPVVLGRAYNGADPFPEPLPAGKTRSALRSLTSPSRAGTNMIRIDDAAASEKVFMHAERDQNIVVGNERHEQVLSDETATVAGYETIDVGSSQSVTVDENWTTEVQGSQTHTVAATRTKEIGGREDAAISGDHGLQVAVSHDRSIGGSDIIKALGITDVVGGLLLQKTLMTSGTGAGAVMCNAVGGVMLELAGLGKGEGWKTTRQELIGGVALALARKTIDQKTAALSTTAGGIMGVMAKSVELEAKASLTATAATMQLSADSSLTLKVGASSVAISSGGITVNAPTIIVDSSGGAGYSP